MLSETELVGLAVSTMQSIGFMRILGAVIIFLLVWAFYDRVFKR